MVQISLNSQWKQILQSQTFIIAVLAILPSLLMSVICYTSLTQFQLQTKILITQYSENLYQSQKNSSKQHNFALGIQFDSQVQQIQWRLYVTNKFYKKILNGQVIKNPNFQATFISLEKTFNQTEDSQLLGLFKRNPILTSTWFNPNHTNFDELNIQSKEELQDSFYLDSLWRAIKYENTINGYSRLQIKDLFLGFENDGALYITPGINSTYSQFKPPNWCLPNVYHMDVRCRFYYQPTIESTSIPILYADIFYSNLGEPFLASIFCQRTDIRNANEDFEKYSILCLNIDLTHISSFMNNFGSNSKFQLFLDPVKLNVIYDSDQSILKGQVINVFDHQIKWMQSKQQQDLFMSTLKNFTSSQILDSFSQVNMVKSLTDNVLQNQLTLEYNINGTDLFAIMNRITFIDKIPNQKDQQLQGTKYLEKLVYIFIDVLTQEQLMEKSRGESQTTSHDIQIGSSQNKQKQKQNEKNQYNIRILKEDQHKNGDNLNDKNLKSQLNFQSMSSRRGGITYFGFIQEEEWKVNIVDFCLSSETKSLFESFQNMFQTLQFITQNIFGGDESQSLLSLSTQIEFFKSIKNYRALGICFNNMGNIHYNCCRYKEALESYQHALIYAQYEIELYKSIDYFCKSETQKHQDIHDNSNNEINEKSREQVCDNDNHSILKENSALRKHDFGQKYKSSINYSKQSMQHPLLNILNNNQTLSNSHNFSSSIKFKLFCKLSKQESEVLWWNIFNRKYNYCQALAGYLKDYHNNNISLWEEMESVVYELLAISSSQFLPQCHKRDMIILYQLSIALLHQNKVYQFLECLSIYEQIYNFSKESKHQAKIESISKTVIRQNLTPQKKEQKPIFQSQEQPNSFSNQHNNPLINAQSLSQKTNKNIFFTPQHYQQKNDQKLHEFPTIQFSAEQSDQVMFQATQKSRFHLNDAPLQLPANFTFKHKEILKKKDSLFLTCEDSPTMLSSRQLEGAYLDENATFHAIRDTQANLFQISKNNISNVLEQNVQIANDAENQSNLIIDMAKINQETPDKLKSAQQFLFGSLLKNKSEQYYSTATFQAYETNSTSLYDIQQQRSKPRNQSQLSNLQSKIGNYSHSAEILTKILERSYVYSPHLKKRILKKLHNIFIKLNIKNPFLLNMKYQYENLQKSNFKICFITNVQKPLQKQECLHLCQDLIQDILTRKQDQLSLINYKQEELIYVQQQMLTPVFIIKKQINHFYQILLKSFTNENDSKQCNNSPLCSQNISFSLYNQDQIKNIQSPLSNLSQNLIHFKSDQNQNASQNFHQQNHQGLTEQFDDEFFSIHKMQKQIKEQEKQIKTENQQTHQNAIISIIDLNNENVGYQVSFKSIDNSNNLQSDVKLNLDISVNGLINIENNNLQPYTKINSINSSQQFFNQNNQEEIIKNCQHQKVENNLKQHQTLQISNEPQKNNTSSTSSFQKININRPSSFKKIFFSSDDKNNSQQNGQLSDQILNGKFDDQEQKNYQKFPSIDSIYEQNNLQQISNFHRVVSCPNTSTTEKEENSNSNLQNSISQQKEQELIFHLGVHIALKRDILNSPQKISFYQAQKKNGKYMQLSENQKEVLSQNYFKFKDSDSYPIQKTFLIYVTDQILVIRNTFLYKELCSLLYNLSIELLVLLQNSYQSTLEQPIDLNAEILNKNVIQFFTSQSKLLQYIYNQRDISNHNLYPTIVEQFQTNSFE
ncbi:hypothetical protein TTHERM_00248320 (macronuclear) [Tetrahymena thermophila SB210]|uniref:Tetratricopeptide repeat protein n=1 Tax=Tetrahymena thermophila (strain SB210) TaxID=312017 RepID=Q245L6_TETTS|nr:hypothetical protein TTHERM_00248320 [Tetrahymena thermophila SB210]EAS03617.2 hypothetical protein TTHERM_00248320 [Tetrahymena thermophila SB210]|eukprot:XP_001023862.2 hypothetical protein TTHERM_00248320 [Tetrahymena thermophila SB210]